MTNTDKTIAKECKKFAQSLKTRAHRQKPKKEKSFGYDFRRREDWLELRRILKEKQKTDFVTGLPLDSNCNLHHGDLRIENYEDLSKESNFIVLNQDTHRTLHFLFGDKNKRNNWRERLRKLEELCLWMERINKES